jgi:tryptophan-rich sensory protein
MSFYLFGLFLSATIVAGASGALFPPGEWYRELQKPGWTPPDWLFPLAWTTLYLCMAVAAARVANLPGSGAAMALWAIQIALNTLWTPVFFGLQRMRAGLIVLVLLWLSVFFCLITFWQLDTIAGVLFLPYIAWVTAAGALNLSVIRLNPQPG